MSSRVSGVAIAVGSALISVIVTVLVVINILAGIVGGIWLAVKGEWGSIVWGVALSFIMPWVWTLVSLPNLGLAFLASKVAEKGSRVGSV